MTDAAKCAEAGWGIGLQVTLSWLSFVIGFTDSIGDWLWLRRSELWQNDRLVRSDQFQGMNVQKWDHFVMSLSTGTSVGGWACFLRVDQRKTNVEAWDFCTTSGLFRLRFYETRFICSIAKREGKRSWQPRFRSVFATDICLKRQNVWGRWKQPMNHKWMGRNLSDSPGWILGVSTRGIFWSASWSFWTASLNCFAKDLKMSRSLVPVASMPSKLATLAVICPVVASFRKAIWQLKTGTGLQSLMEICGSGWFSGIVRAIFHRWWKTLSALWVRVRALIFVRIS